MTLPTLLNPTQWGSWLPPCPDPGGWLNAWTTTRDTELLLQSQTCSIYISYSRCTARCTANNGLSPSDCQVTVCLVEPLTSTTHRVNLFDKRNRSRVWHRRERRDRRIVFDALFRTT